MFYLLLLSTNNGQQLMSESFWGKPEQIPLVIGACTKS